MQSWNRAIDAIYSKKSVYKTRKKNSDSTGVRMKVAKKIIGGEIILPSLGSNGIVLLMSLYLPPMPPCPHAPCLDVKCQIFHHIHPVGVCVEEQKNTHGGK